MATETPGQPAARLTDLPRLTGLRAFAALSVFICHMWEDVGWKHGHWFRDGYAGVSFFFMLSGFVLTWGATSGRRPGVVVAGGFRSALQFYRRRFARVWPVHMAVLLLFYYLFHPTPAAWPTDVLLLTVLLVQAWNVVPIYAIGINAVAWSLSDEAFFYAVWPLVVRVFTALNKWVAWLLVVLLYVVLLTATWDYFEFAPDHRFFPYLFPPIRLVEFLAGVLLASAMRRGWRSPVPLVPSVGLLVVEVVLLRLHDWHVASFPGLLLDPLLLLLVASAATADVAGKSGVLRSRPLLYAGKVSFAFYLVHVGTFQYLQIHAPHLQFDSNHGVAAIFACAAAVAILLHHLVELPMNRLLRPRHDKPVSV